MFSKPVLDSYRERERERERLHILQCEEHKFFLPPSVEFLCLPQVLLLQGSFATITWTFSRFLYQLLANTDKTYSFFAPEQFKTHT